MTKRLLSMLLVLVIVAAMVVVPANAQSDAENVTAVADTCPCGCGQALAQVRWEPWDANNQSVLATGHYYLEDNYIQDDYKSVISGNRIVLDLRGHTLTTKSYSRLFYVYGYLAVLDTVGGGLFSAKTSGTALGGIVIVSSNETNDPTFELHSGTIMPDPDSKGGKRGGLIHLADSATFRMTGGRIMGGTTVTPSGDASTGGNICAYYASSRIEILGGELIGGISTSHGGNIYSKGTTILKNCTLIGGRAESSGGNICQVGGTLTAENCTFSHGIANHSTTNGGGNIALLSSPAATIKGCTLENGYAANFGGNLLATNGSLCVEDTRFVAGTASRGGNLYLGSAVTDALLKDVQIPGDVICFSDALSLEGVVKIGLLSNGLRLGTSSSPVAVDAEKLEAGSEIYVDATGTFTNGGTSYFKGALRTVLNGAEATQAADGEIGGYCPHCNTQVAWTAYDPTACLVAECLHDSTTDSDPTCTGNHLESGHYYLTKNLTGQSQKYIGVYRKDVVNETKDIVIDLRSYDITATGRAFYLRPDASGTKNTLTILDSTGGGVIAGSGTNTYAGGVFYADGGVINVYGGKLQYKTASAKVVFNGGVVASYGTLNVYGGVLDGSAYYLPETDPETTRTIAYRGGAIYLGTNKTLNMTGGAVLGGKAWTGGALFTLTSDNIQVTGGHFIGGTSNYDGTDAGGGSIHLYATSSNRGTAQFANCAITGGTVDCAKSGGNLLATNYTAEIEDSFIAYGSTGGYGGNLVASSGGTLSITDSIVYGGRSTGNSGNIHVTTTTSQLNLTGSLVTAGVAGTSGGNCTLGHGYNNLYGGEISFGTAKTYGGNIAATAGNYSATCDQYSRFQKDDGGNVPLICGGNAGTYGGNVYVGGVLYMDAAKLQSGSAGTSGQDLYLPEASNQGKLVISSGVTDAFNMAVASSLLGADTDGQVIANTECSQLNATIHLDGDPNEAQIVAHDGKLYVGAASVIDSQGQVCWYANNATAIAATDDNSYVKVYTDNDIVLTKNCTVDLNGHTVAISGAHEVRGMDSVTDAGDDSAGKATLGEGTDYTTDYTAPNGKRYLGIPDGEYMTWHCLDMRITAVSLRPSNASIYYNAVWNCDNTLKAMIQNFGIAVSIAQMPTANFVNESKTLYTALGQDAFVCGEEMTSALVYNILEDSAVYSDSTGSYTGADANDRRGQVKLYATPYVILSNGTNTQCLVADDSSTKEDDVAYSMKDVLTVLGGLVDSQPDQFHRYTPSLRNFYGTWKENGMANWGLADNSAFEAPADDGVIDVLMIGNSFCYNYVEELYGLAEAAGIKMRVCNVYYSGCKMYEHYNWWMAGESNYQFYITDDNGRRGVGGKSLDWCLAQGEWDVISLQESSGRVRNNGSAAESLEKDRICYDTLLPYLEVQFPNARTLWHQTWALQIGYETDDCAISTVEDQMAYYELCKEHAELITDTYGWELVPSGDAWQIVREGGYDLLCARLGKADGDNPHAGDYYHDGDIGGGQYLNACVWFEIITGQSCVGNTYVPTYIYSGQTYSLNEGITVETLQNAAHQAVEAMRANQAEG